MKQSKLIIGLVVGLGLMTSANASQVPAFPLLIDDFNFTTGSTATDTDSTVGSYVIMGRGTGGNHWGIREGIMANLTNGTSVNTIDDDISKQGIFTSESEGHGFWYWSGPSITGILDVEFDYSTNVAGADIIVSFGDANGNYITQFQWSDLASTNGIMTAFHASLPSMSNLDISVIDFDIFSVGGVYTDPTDWLGNLNLGAAAPNLDFHVDNLYLTPEPATLALMGLGLASLGWNRHRKSPSTAL